MVGWINLRAFTVHGSSFKVVGSLRKIGWLDSLEKYIYIYFATINFVAVYMILRPEVRLVYTLEI